LVGALPVQGEGGRVLTAPVLHLVVGGAGALEAFPDDGGAITDSVLLLLPS